MGALEVDRGDPSLVVMGDESFIRVIDRLARARVQRI